MSDLQSVQIIQAIPGYIAIYENDGFKNFELCDNIIAWRFETYNNRNDELYTLCVPLCTEGDVGCNCIGVQTPLGTVELFGDCSLDSFTDIENHYKKIYPEGYNKKKKAKNNE